MRKILLLLIALLVFVGCGKLGEGSYVGYPYSINSGIFWDKVNARTDLESSKIGCAVIPKNSPLRTELEQYLDQDVRVKFYYENHFFIAANCANSVLTSFEILDK